MTQKNQGHDIHSGPKLPSSQAQLSLLGGGNENGMETWDPDEARVCFCKRRDSLFQKAGRFTHLPSHFTGCLCGP